MHPYRRLLVLVDKKFQLNFTFFILAIFLIQNLFLIGSIVYWSNDILEFVSNNEIATKLNNFRNHYIIFLSLFALLSLGIIYVLLIFKTHKIAGPIFKLKKTLKESKEEGEVKELILRSGDYFSELTDIYNNSIKGFKTKD